MKRLLGGLVLGWALVAVGCDRRDAEKLGAVAARLAERPGQLLPEHTSFRSTWDQIRTVREESTPQTRVRQRIHTDRYLRPWKLEVLVQGREVTIAGEVNDPILRDRAIELAQSTVGIEKVHDQIVVRPATE